MSEPADFFEFMQRQKLDGETTRGWFRMQKKGTRAEIVVYDFIGFWGVSAKAFRDELLALGEVEEIDLRIHSEGGDVLDALAIHNLLSQHPAKVIAHVDGIAASAATLVAMGADHVQIADNAWFMVHNPWSMVVGEADDMRQVADVLDGMRGSILKAYKRHSNLSEDELIAAMDAETWYDADEAVAAGFAHEITKSVKAAASLRRDLSTFSHVPAAVAEAWASKPPARIEEIPPGVTDEPEEEEEMDLEALQESMRQAVSDAVTPLRDELQAKIGELEARIEEGRRQATERVVTSEREQLLSRIEALASNGQVPPTVKDKLVGTLEGTEDFTATKSLLEAYEALPRSAASRLGSERVSHAGDRTQATTTTGRNPVLIEIHNEAVEESQGDPKKYRELVYAAHGEPVAPPQARREKE